MKVIFVGMHNKPGMKPLDSKTRTGKVIDRIIEKLPGIDSQKSNLFEDNYHPQDKKEIWAGNLHWYDKYQPSYDDIIVLLGSWVHKEFLLKTGNIIKLSHPASRFGDADKVKYVSNAVSKINELILINNLGKINH